ncbi:hypothetical protein STEG23_036932, partial [Scotinomys teguina]
IPESGNHKGCLCTLTHALPPRGRTMKIEEWKSMNQSRKHLATPHLREDGVISGGSKHRHQS